jgi:hypothetical protein
LDLRYLIGVAHQVQNILFAGIGLDPRVVGDIRVFVQELGFWQF